MSMEPLTPAACAARRTALGVSAHELARRAGLIERTIRHFEGGQTRPRPVTLAPLRKALRILEAEAAAGRGEPGPRRTR